MGYVTLKEFLERSVEIHKDKYTYENVHFNNTRDRVYITCKLHGEFYQIVNNHLMGAGCRKCGYENRITKKKHGKLRTSEYYSWQNMKNRCYRPTTKQYEDYGGRGITMCERWKDRRKGFQNFLEDMGIKPDPNYSLDRIDNNKGYYKENCRWADKTMQCINRRKFHNKKEETSVYWSKISKGYYVRVSKENKKYYGGFYKNLEDAQKKNKELRKEVYPEIYK